MPSTKEIRTRIKSVKNTAQITRAMQLVAASKMKKAQDSALKGRTYAVLLAEILASAVERVEGFEHPLLSHREVKKRGILILSTDKGLCGGLNANLFKKVIEESKGGAAFVTVGRKAAQFVARTKRELLADFPVSDRSAFAEIRPIVEFMLKAFEDGEIDTIEVIYPRFVNTLVQQATCAHLAPLEDLAAQVEDVRKRFGVELSDVSQDHRDMIFEPSIEAVLSELPGLFLKTGIYQLVLESKASEHSARMVAMKAATDNAKNLVDDLTLQFNKARQAAITAEILEIAAASAADTV